MFIEGKIIAALPVRQGESQRGTWVAQEFVLETNEQYPKHVCFNVFGQERLQQFSIHQGEVLKVHIAIDARQKDGRWFNSIQAWQVERPTQQVQPSYQQPQQSAQPQQPIQMPQNFQPYQNPYVPNQAQQPQGAPTFPPQQAEQPLPL